MFNEKTLPVRIRRYRIACGMKQKDVAAALFVSSQTVSKWENGLTVPDIGNLCRLSELFGVSVDALLSDGGADARLPAYVAIDGGGTNTEGILFDAEGNVLRRTVAEGSNPTAIGLKGTFAVITKISEALADPDVTVKGVFAGIAGCGKGSRAEQVRTFLRTLYPGARTGAGSDAFNILHLENGDCIAAIMGTGSAVFARRGNEIFTYGGWGPYLDMAGGGCDVGREAVRAALAETEGFGEPTVMTQMVAAECKGDPHNAILDAKENPQSYFGSFAHIAFDAYRMGDPVAKRIIGESTSRIALLIKSASRRYGTGKTVLLSGGLLHSADVILPLLRKELGDAFLLTVPDLPQVYGAAVVAREADGPLPQGFRETFASGYADAVSKGKR